MQLLQLEVAAQVLESREWQRYCGTSLTTSPLPHPQPLPGYGRDLLTPRLSPSLHLCCAQPPPAMRPPPPIPPTSASSNPSRNTDPTTTPPLRGLPAAACALAALFILLVLHNLDALALARQHWLPTMTALALPISSTASNVGATLASLCLLALHAARGSPERAQQRVHEALLCTAALVPALAGGAHLNEYVLKPAFARPRPNILLLSAVPSPSAPLLGMGPAAFYMLGDKAVRRNHLADVLEHPEIAATLHVPPALKAHWLHETGYSFPSGHSYAAALLVVFFLALGLARGERWRRVLPLALPLWAFAVACSRVLLVVHTVADVVVGLAMGASVGYLAALVTERLLVNTTAS